MVLTGFNVSTSSLKWRSRLNHGVFSSSVFWRDNKDLLFKSTCFELLWVSFMNSFLNFVLIKVVCFFFSLFYLKAIIALAYVTLALKVISVLCNVSLLISVGTVSKEKSRWHLVLYYKVHFSYAFWHNLRLWSANFIRHGWLHPRMCYGRTVLNTFARFFADWSQRLDKCEA